MADEMLRLEPLKAVKARIGLSEATIYRLLAAGKFPKAHRRVGKKSLWLSTDVDAWIWGDWSPSDRMQHTSQREIMPTLPSRDTAPQDEREER